MKGNGGIFVDGIEVEEFPDGKPEDEQEEDTMADWSQHAGPTGDSRNCSDCHYGDVWKPYNPPILVCRQPAVMKQLGGPRSCRDLVRSPGGICGPEGSRWVKRATVNA